MKKGILIMMMVSIVASAFAQNKAGKVDTMKRKAFSPATTDNRALSTKEKLKLEVVAPTAKPIQVTPLRATGDASKKEQMKAEVMKRRS